MDTGRATDLGTEEAGVTDITRRIADLPENDRRYVEHTLDVIQDEVEGARLDFDTVHAWAYLEAIRDQAGYCARILLDGEPSPWADTVPENYLAVMSVMKSDAEQGRRFEDRLGPIVVVEEFPA